jgi:phenol/toluene 2-monooxygenase (NADH) P1/A1
MQIDLKTVALTPLRNTFKHLERRFGDKVASRYQEATFDLQPTLNFHYRPTWDPQREIHDTGRTKIVLKDWYVLKDPRQFYYNTYTQARSRQQDAVDKNFEFVEDRFLPLALDAEIKDRALQVLLPLRHVAWGANMNNNSMAAYAYGAALNQACTFASFDHLGIAQYLTRIGLTLGEVEDLQAGKEAWEKGAAWQPLRKYVEDTLVVRDVMELFVAQNFALDGLLYPLVYEECVDGAWASKSGPTIGMMTVFMVDWFAETSKWVDAVIKAAAAESPENKALLSTWASQWIQRSKEALAPVAHLALGASGSTAMTEVEIALRERAKKCGLELTV